MLRAASRAADVVAAGDTMRQVIAHAAIYGTAMYRRTEDGGVTLVDTAAPDPLRSHPAWRRYTRATSRLRLCTGATPRSIQRARFAAVLELELAIIRDTQLTQRTIFDAAEEASDRVLHRARRWAA
jgi:hypothetical protein